MKDNSTGKDKEFYSRGKQMFDNIVESSKPAQRKWVGLTDEEIWKGLTDADWSNIMDRRDTALDTFQQGAVWAADILRRRNT
jgi:hypothetical protein